MTDAFEEIAAAIGRLDSTDFVKTLLTKALSQGVSATEIAEKAIRRGLQIVGERYEAGDYFLSELLYAGSLVSDLSQLLKPEMENLPLERLGVIVLGTVRGDIHDIGKNIFKMLADGTGFEVHDLGVDIEPATFVNEIKESSPQILGLSALLTTSLVEMKETINALQTANVRSNIKVLLGGNAVKKEFGSQIGADATALDAVEGIDTCRTWTRE